MACDGKLTPTPGHRLETEIGRARSPPINFRTQPIVINQSAAFSWTISKCTPRHTELLLGAVWINQTAHLNNALNSFWAVKVKKGALRVRFGMHLRWGNRDLECESKIDFSCLNFPPKNATTSLKRLISVFFFILMYFLIGATCINTLE